MSRNKENSSITKQRKTKSHSIVNRRTEENLVENFRQGEIQIHVFKINYKRKSCNLLLFE